MITIESHKANKIFRKVPQAYENYALKWLADEIHLTEIAENLTGKNRKWGSTSYARIAIGLRQAFRKGKLRLSTTIK